MVGSNVLISYSLTGNTVSLDRRLSLNNEQYVPKSIFLLINNLLSIWLQSIEYFEEGKDFYKNYLHRLLQ